MLLSAAAVVVCVVVKNEKLFKIRHTHTHTPTPRQYYFATTTATRKINLSFSSCWVYLAFKNYLSFLAAILIIGICQVRLAEYCFENIFWLSILSFV
jgi:hypothetical protein